MNHEKNMKNFIRKGYGYNPEGNWLYQEMCRQYTYYDHFSCLDKYEECIEKGLFGKIASNIRNKIRAITWFISKLNILFEIFFFPLFIKIIFQDINILYAILIGLGCIIINRALIYAQDFIGEFFCKFNGIITGLMYGILIEYAIYKVSSIDDFIQLTSNDKIKFLGIFVICITFWFKAFCLYWKSKWYLKHLKPSTLTHFISRGLQKLRKSYIDKIDKQFNNNAYKYQNFYYVK